MSELYTNYKVNTISATDAGFADIDLASDAIICSIVTSDTYTFSAAHQDEVDITIYSGSLDQTLPTGNITTAAGVFDCTSDLTFADIDIDGSSTVDELIHWKDTTTPATSPLICYHEGFTPVTPNGGDITIAYNGSGIFAI